MKNKKILKYIILILGIVLLIIGLIILTNKKDNNNSTNSENNANIEEKPNINAKQVYTCENKLSDEGDSYTSYQIETVYVEDGIVKKTVPTMKIVCNDKGIYTVFKNDKEYSKGKDFDEKNLTITFANGEEVSLEKDVNGNETKMKFSDYEMELKNLGYNCIGITN